MSGCKMGLGRKVEKTAGGWLVVATAWGTGREKKDAQHPTRATSEARSEAKVDGPHTCLVGVHEDIEITYMHDRRLNVSGC